jgi:hypothetical protein
MRSSIPLVVWQIEQFDDAQEDGDQSERGERIASFEAEACFNGVEAQRLREQE